MVLIIIIGLFVKIELLSKNFSIIICELKGVCTFKIFLFIRVLLL